MAYLGLRFLGLFALRRACLLIRVINNSILNFLISPDNRNGGYGVLYKKEDSKRRVFFQEDGFF